MKVYFADIILGLTGLHVAIMAQGQSGFKIDYSGNAPHPTAILELDPLPAYQGFLLPRLNTSQRNAITNPALGLIIFNIDCKTIDFWDGSQWLHIDPSIANNPLPTPKASWATNWSSTGFTANWQGSCSLYKLEVSYDSSFTSLLPGYPKYTTSTNYNVSVPSCGVYYYRVSCIDTCYTQLSGYSNTIEALAANLPQIGPNQWTQLIGIHTPPAGMPVRDNHVVARVGKKNLCWNG